MGIARPQAIEKILYHMANVGNLTPKYNKYGNKYMSTAIEKEMTGQQRLPLYSEKFMKDFDQITGAMNEEKLSAVASNLISPEEYKIALSSESAPSSAFFAWPHKPTNFQGGVALPEQAVLDYGPTAISHEGRHLEVYRDFGDRGQQVFRDLYSEPNELFVKNPGEGNKYIGRKSNYPGIHSNLSDLNEFDAAMSEVGTFVKAGDPEMKTGAFYGSIAPEFKQRKLRDMKLLWSVLPPKVQKHFIETAALGGVAAPSIGAFQPETSNK